jgi:hypothetical protein
MGTMLFVHPPVTIARDWIDYPYFADLGAVQLAGELLEKRLHGRGLHGDRLGALLSSRDGT